MTTSVVGACVTAMVLFAFPLRIDGRPFEGRGFAVSWSQPSHN